MAEPCRATVNNSPRSGRREFPVLLPLGDLERRLLSDVADQEVHEDVLAVVALVDQPVVRRPQPLCVQVVVIPGILKHNFGPRMRLRRGGQRGHFNSPKNTEAALFKMSS